MSATVVASAMMVEVQVAVTVAATADVRRRGTGSEKANVVLAGTEEVTAVAPSPTNPQGANQRQGANQPQGAGRGTMRDRRMRSRSQGGNGMMLAVLLVVVLIVAAVVIYFVVQN